MDSFHKVREFHEVFRHPVAPFPTLIEDPALRLLRIKLIAEELQEYAWASGFRLEILLNRSPVQGHDDCIDLEYATPDMGHGRVDIIEAADALADIEYVTHGAHLVWGFPGPALLAEVHASNMSKLGADGKPIYREDGKVLKGPGYRKPNIAGVLLQHGARLDTY